MKILIAVVMSFFSGFLIYMMAGLLLPHEPSGLFVFVTLVGSWAASIYVLLKNARSIGKVVSRGFLLGAAEWMVMIVVGFIFSGRAVSDSLTGASSSAAGTAGAVIGGGLIAFITGGVSVAMAIVCLIGFAISYSMSREMKAEQAEPTKKCPECAELVQQDAKRCRFCGADLSSPLARLDAQLT